MSNFDQVKRQALQSRLRFLIEQYEVVNKQIDLNLSISERIRLQEHSNAIEKKLNSVEKALSIADGPPKDYGRDRQPFSKIFGRDAENELLDFLNGGHSRGEHSFVTLCGMPGIGKTALASRLFRLHPNSAWVSPPIDIEDCKAYFARTSKELFRGQEKSIAAIHHLLSVEDIWLFLNGVDTFIDTDELRQFLLRLYPTDKGKVIVISRKPTRLRSEYQVLIGPAFEEFTDMLLEERKDVISDQNSGFSLSKLSTKLFEILRKRLTLEELQTICFLLEIEYENLSASTKDGKARELILHSQRQNQLDKIVWAGRQYRPDIDWPI